MGDALRIFIKITYSIILTLLLLGCKQGDESKDSLQDQITDSLQDQINAYQSRPNVFVHDGSTGGAYGIGEGWSVEISSPVYETYTKNIVVQEGSEEVVSSAKYKWVKEDSEDLNIYPKVETKIVIIPPQHETVTLTIEFEPMRIEYYLSEPVYNSSGTLETAGVVKSRDIPAITKRVSRRVVKTPVRIEERPVARRKGYVRVLKKPVTISSRTIPAVFKPVTISRVKYPQRFVIKRPDGEIAHIFDTVEDFTAFTDNLK